MEVLIWITRFLFLPLLLSQSLAEPGTESCELKSANLSLAALAQPYYLATGSLRNSSIKAYLSLCKPLSQLPSEVIPLCDTEALACFTKIDSSGKEVELARNVGTALSGLKLDNNGHLGLVLQNGSMCTSRSNTSLASRIDFFCNEDPAQGNIIQFEGMLGECEYQIFWHTSLACLPAQPQELYSGTCVITRIPGYDTTIDLSVWADKNEGYYLARSVDGKSPQRLFHLNLCQPVINSPCPEGSVICELDDTEMEVVQVVANSTNRHTVSYNEDTETISLNYKLGRNAVNINIHCDRTATRPQVTLESEDFGSYSFRFLTKEACLVPPVQCMTEDTEGRIYDLSSLREQEHDVGVGSEGEVRYTIKVCGSLSVTHGNPCAGQTGVCRYRTLTSDNGTSLQTDALNLGIMYRRPVLNGDGSLSLRYEHGDLYVEQGGNNSCNMSAELQLICSDRELGPRLLDSTACSHRLVWRTPAACPQAERVVSERGSCAVREPLFSHLFNLSSLYNTSTDHFVTTQVGGKSNSLRFVMNVCGPLLSDCNPFDRSTVCLEQEDEEKGLAYEDGSLMLDFSSNRTCDKDPNKKITARIVFLCNHEEEVGEPEAADAELDEGCRVDFQWPTRLACPPHDQVPCSVTTKQGVVDLTELSLPQQNYEVKTDEGEIVILNICRSLVHSNQSHCPYQSSACLQHPGSTADENLGQLHSGPSVDTEGKIFISYSLGSICKDPSSNLSHLKTTIYFSCDATQFESRPEFLERSGCHYQFQWRHAAACPRTGITQGNCTVKSKESDFTFDLSSLFKREGSWSYRDTRGTGFGRNSAISLDMNICGPIKDSPCGEGVGLCLNNQTNFGYSNAYLQLDANTGLLSMTYSGPPCPYQPAANTEAKINFICPPRRSLSSGNKETDGPKLFRPMAQNNQCRILIDFHTDLACDHQVYCDVLQDNSILPLTKLRRHDVNYKVPSRDGRFNFSLNICGPLVATDVPQSGCNPQGVCGQNDDTWLGMGRVWTPPRLAANGHIELIYDGGDRCSMTAPSDSNGKLKFVEKTKDSEVKRWSTKIVFTCNNHTYNPIHPFGLPVHVSTDNRTCENVFRFATSLACAGTVSNYQVQQPESCQMYHPGRQRHVDLKQLYRKEHYRVHEDEGARVRGSVPRLEEPAISEEYYEIQPCGSLVKGCGGAICKVNGATSYSLGSLSDITYDPNTDALRVRYVEGDVCNSVTGQRYASKIYYSCDPAAEGEEGAGQPTINTVLDCMVVFDWKTRIICDESQLVGDDSGGRLLDIEISPPSSPSSATPPAVIETMTPEHNVAGSPVWGELVLAVLFLVGIGVTIHLYRNQESRERVRRWGQEMRARLPVALGGRRREDSTLLVSGMNSTMESLSDDDDFA